MLLLFRAGQREDKKKKKKMAVIKVHLGMAAEAKAGKKINKNKKQKSRRMLTAHLKMAEKV